MQKFKNPILRVFFPLQMLAISFIAGLFLLISIDILVYQDARRMPWHQALVFGEAFRIDDQKLLLFIMRRCDRPSIKINYFTSHKGSVTSLTSVVQDCGSVLSNLLTSKVSVELGVTTLSTRVNRLYAMIENKNFVELPVVSHHSTFGNTSSNTTGSSNSNFPNLDDNNSFTVCVLQRSFSTSLKLELDEVKSIPQVAAFFESWLFYGATNFIVYDTKFNVISPLAKMYNDTVIEMPFYNKKQILQEDFPNLNVFYAYDCLLRSRLTRTTKWTVLTSFDEIPIVLTKSSLATALILLATPNSTYSVANDRTEQITIQIFDPQKDIGFDNDANVISDQQIVKAPSEVLNSLNILQLNADIFQQSSSSSMNQVFNFWVQKYRLRVSKARKGTIGITV